MNLKKNLRENWSTVALVVLTTVLTYGVFIPQLGFYRDDWYMIWAGQVRGLQGIIDLFQTDRPFIGYLYALDYRLLGAAPIGWHLLALVVRLISGLSFLWFVRLLWTSRKTETLLLTLLYVVYPGFLQQGNAATYINLLMAVAASVLSLALTALALRSQNWKRAAVFTLGAFLLVIFYLSIFESMIGLEAARLLIIFYLLMQIQQRDWKSTLKQTILWALPYLLAAGGFLIWRVFLFKAARHSTDLDSLLAGYAVSPLRAVATISIEAVKDFIETVFMSWIVPLYQYTVKADYADLALSLVLAALVVGGTLFHLRLNREDDQTTYRFSPTELWIGALITLLAILPINLAGRSVSFSLGWDRYTLHTALGAVLLVGGLALNGLNGRARIGLLLALVAGGVVTQVHSGAYYRDFWTSQRNLWWQLSWRAPDIDEGTLLYARLPGGFSFFEDYEIYSAANLIYSPDEKIKISADLINSQTVPLLISREVKGKTHREVYVRKNYKNALMMVFPAGDSCLHVLDGQKVELPGFGSMDLLYLAPFSKIGRINVAAPPAVPSETIFGKPPEQNWCYYYQKISLARQQENWTEAARLSDEAAEKQFQPRDRSEWIPVFEAYANTGQLEKAAKVTPLMNENRDMVLLFCSQLTNRDNFPASYNFDYVSSTLCKPSP
ncbi:MAG: hypothetical protein HY865_26410 [Chloroflexi bacterium]|nr:hypothetical protein [Chloroflexota bacterium]